MSTYTEVFGGTVVYPSDVSYLALSLTENITLGWPLENSTSANPAARIIDVTPTGAYAIDMPPADETGVGQTVLFNNLGPDTVEIRDNAGNTLASILQGQQWQIYLYDNSTAAGSWRVFRYGAATAQAQASALAGYGLKATGSTLSQDAATTLFSIDYSLGNTDRAANFVWTGGLGNLDLPSAATVGNGWFVSVRNGGTGNLVLNPSGSETINDASTLTMQPGDSAVVTTDGIGWYTIGFGQDAVFAFDYTSIDLTGQSSPYTLSGAELNRIAYSFVGVLTADMVIVVPPTTQQYWVDNETSGSYTLGVATASQVTPADVAQGGRDILYCNGSDVVGAVTGGIAVPLGVAQGGTGATTAGGALISLGGTATGIAVFTAASAAAARAAINAASPEEAQVFAVAMS